MATIATTAALQHPIPRHSLQHGSMFISQPAPPFEGIVDFTHTSPQQQPASHTMFGQHAVSTTEPSYHQQQQQHLLHRSDVTEWKQPSFFSYKPNEVKHRKRTTRQQLKVLEETFRATQKPDGNVRKALAAQLDMTPRNVQVWFQNRRAKDKTLAKRAQKFAEEATTNETSASLDESQPESQDYPCEQVLSLSTTHSSSASPIEATFPQTFEVQTPVHHAQNITPPQSRAISLTSNSLSSLEAEKAPSQLVQPSFSAQSTYAVEAPQPSYSKSLFAPRSSLPHIRATPFQPQDIQHQRCNSSPAFLCNVDTSSNLSLTTYASINGVLYPQRFPSTLSHQPSQSVYNSSYRVPAGPLPSADFTFGVPAPTNTRPSAETDRDSDPISFARYQFGSMSGNNTPSSLSTLSQYGSVASLVDSDVASLAAQGFEDDSSSPFPWHNNEQRRGSASHGMRPYLTNRISRGFSPLSVGHHSPQRAGTTPPTEPESDGSDRVAVYIPNHPDWIPAYEESKQTVQHVASVPMVSTETKSLGGFQQDGASVDRFVEQDNADTTLQYMTMLDTQSYAQPMTLANQISGLDAAFGSNAQVPLGGFRPLPATGCPFV